MTSSYHIFHFVIIVEGLNPLIFLVKAVNSKRLGLWSKKKEAIWEKMCAVLWGKIKHKIESIQRGDLASLLAVVNFFWRVFYPPRDERLSDII